MVRRGQGWGDGEKSEGDPGCEQQEERHLNHPSCECLGVTVSLMSPEMLGRQVGSARTWGQAARRPPRAPRLPLLTHCASVAPTRQPAQGGDRSMSGLDGD